MNKPKLTDRTKLYVGLFHRDGDGTYTLGACINNTLRSVDTNVDWPMVANPHSLYYLDSLTTPIECPLTLVKLANMIRATKVADYTHLVVANCTFVWAQHTPNGIYGLNHRFFKPHEQWCGGEVECYADWRAALPVLKKRLTARLQEIRKAGKKERLEYNEFMNAQAVINKAQAIEIRTNNRYFKGIPF